MLIGLATVLLWAGALAKATGAHPMHTSLSEIEYDADRQVVEIRVRLFADDLNEAVTWSSAGLPPDSILSRYVRGTLALADRAGPLRLLWRGAQRSGDMVLLQLQAKAPANGLSHIRVLVAMLWERFPDQVNIVRVSYDAHVYTLLFTRGDFPRVIAAGGLQSPAERDPDQSKHPQDACAC